MDTPTQTNGTTTLADSTDDRLLGSLLADPVGFLRESKKEGLASGDARDPRLRLLLGAAVGLETEGKLGQETLRDWADENGSFDFEEVTALRANAWNPRKAALIWENKVNEAVVSKQVVTAENSLDPANGKCTSRPSESAPP